MRSASKDKSTHTIPVISRVLSDGSLVELIYNKKRHETAFAHYKDDNLKVTKEVEDSGQLYVPYSSQNSLLSNDVVLFPSKPVAYGSVSELVREIRTFIHRYVDLSEHFEKIAAYYVLLTWVYDGFNELPYLRLRGQYGSGKTRFLLVVGALCNKPIFASGASTVSPIFHLLNSFGGTLILDEADFRFSDEKADIVKILNNGNVRGLPVLRTEVTKSREFNPRAFHVFGPKLIATRKAYEDRALESRFITEETGGRPLRTDIPINLPSEYKDEALMLRNKLLSYRFENYGKCTPKEALVDRSIEPRINQVFAPLLSVIEDEATRNELRELAKKYHGEQVYARGDDEAAVVLTVIAYIFTRSENMIVTIKEITKLVNEKNNVENEPPVSYKHIGSVIRNTLQLSTKKSHGSYVIPVSETRRLKQLYARYGITHDDVEAFAELRGPRDEFVWKPLAEGGLGDLGDFEHDILNK